MAEAKLEDIKELRKKTFAGLALCKEALSESGGDMYKAIEYVNKRSDVVSRLYNQTGAKIIHCKLAFEESEGDFEKAVDIIKERGWMEDSAGEGAEEDTSKEGVLGTYVHTDRKLVTIVEVFCDTDFVAKSDAFINLANDLAMQAAAAGARYTIPEHIPEEEMEVQKKIVEESDEFKDKSEDVIEKILEGKMEKFFEKNCLVCQKFFKDDTKQVQELVDDAISSLGEKIHLGRIYRIRLGE